MEWASDQEGVEYAGSRPRKIYYIQRVQIWTQIDQWRPHAVLLQSHGMIMTLRQSTVHDLQSMDYALSITMTLSRKIANSLCAHCSLLTQQRTDVHPVKGDKSDWIDVNGAGRIKRMREFTPRYLRQFSRKKHKKKSDFQKFLIKWRKFSIDFLNAEYWKPVEESNKNYSAIVGNLWQKICNMTGTNITALSLLIIVESIQSIQSVTN